MSKERLNNYEARIELLEEKVLKLEEQLEKWIDKSIDYNKALIDRFVEIGLIEINKDSEEHKNWAKGEIK